MSVTLHTTCGDIKLELFCEDCPKTCENFLALCASGYYKDNVFHRFALDIFLIGVQFQFLPALLVDNCYIPLFLHVRFIQRNYYAVKWEHGNLILYKIQRWWLHFPFEFRNIKDFMVQTGDPTGTGKGGQSCWGAPFDDELVPQLRVSVAFNLIAMFNIL